MVNVLWNICPRLKIVFVLLSIKLEVEEASAVSATVATTLGSTVAILGPSDVAPLEEALVKLTRLDKCFSNACK